MRRKDREIKDMDEIIAIIEKCDVCRIALNNEEGYPYILPINFGMDVKNGVIELYFHGAMVGTKYDLMQKDSRASFEMDCGHRLAPDVERGNCTMEYESVIGRGHMEILPEEEKNHAIEVLMRHYHQEEFPYNKGLIPVTNFFRLTVESVTAKALKKKK